MKEGEAGVYILINNANTYFAWCTNGSFYIPSFIEVPKLN